MNPDKNTDEGKISRWTALEKKRSWIKEITLRYKDGTSDTMSVMSPRFYGIKMSVNLDDVEKEIVARLANPERSVKPVHVDYEVGFINELALKHTGFAAGKEVEDITLRYKDGTSETISWRVLKELHRAYQNRKTQENTEVAT